MHSPSSKSATTNEDLPPPTIEQTPTRFLAACSKHDLEPNPFEQSFSGVNPLSESSGTNSPKPSLPPVAQLESPSAGITTNEDQYGWNLQSLRSGPLSPSMLAGPQDSMMFDDIRAGRTGTTPLPYGSFPDPSPRTAALFGTQNSSLSSSFMNVMTLSNAANATDPFGRNVFAQNVQKPLTDSDRKTISDSVTSVSGASTSQPGVLQSGVNATNLLGITNGSNTVAPSASVMVTNPLGQTVMVANPALNRNMLASNQQDTINRNVSMMSDTIMPKTENDDFTDSAIILNNGTHSNGISSNISHHKGSVLTAEDSLISEQPPSKKNGQKSKSDMTDEEKRRNFLERNRQAALKCRQRKKQWLANLQAKVEYLTNDNETLQNQAQSLREEILNLKTLLLAHKDCPIAQANGVMGLESIQPTVGGMAQNLSGMNVGHNGIPIGMVPGNMQGGIPVTNVQGTMGMTNVQVPQHMSNHVNGPPGSGMMRY
ncbi:16783_t:CDS:2 [Funneliformis geosporum]|nr:16783_t:CDS:2 [Funneliformis geosporum]